MKTYNIEFSLELYDELEVRANARNLTVTELLRKIIKLGFVVLDGHATVTAQQDGQAVEVEL